MILNNGYISGVLRADEAYLRSRFGSDNELVYRRFLIPAFQNDSALIVYAGGLADTATIEQSIIQPLIRYTDLPKHKYFVKGPNRSAVLLESGIFTSAVRENDQWGEVCDAIMAGDAVLIADGCNTALVLSVRKYPSRSVEEPSRESEVRGPRDGFVENLGTNMALIRRRLKDDGLRFEGMQIGLRTKTEINLAYMDNLVNQGLLAEVRKRLQRINVDAILSSAYIEEFIVDSPYSIFPQIDSTERPDKAAAAILEGRIVILVDNTPFALIVPAVFWQFFQSSGDYYQQYYLGTFLRWLRLLALSMAISLPSLYVLLTSFHQEMLPTALALKIAASRQGVPFPAVLEAFLMEIILEIMKEAGLHMPKPIGQTVSIVGTLVIGQAAVTAGLVSPLLVIIIAVAAISSFAIPSYAMSNSLRLVRFPLLFLSAIFGLMGYLGGIVIIMFHLMSLRSFGVPFLAPLIPFQKNGLRDVLLRSPWWMMSHRPDASRALEKQRQSSGTMKPAPPRKKP